MIRNAALSVTHKFLLNALAGILVLLILGEDISYGQLGTQPPGPSGSVSQQSQSPSPGPTAKEIKESAAKEIKESKETIRDYPSVGVGIANAIAWPVCLLLIVMVLMSGVIFSAKFRRLFGLTKIVREIKAGGIEMKIDADLVKDVEKHLRESFADLVADAKLRYQEMASAQRISQHLSRVVLEALPEVLSANNLAIDLASVRATVHVPDIIFQEFLYQLIDYFPVGGGADRRFPEGFGIIGRSWRLGESMGRGIAVVPGPTGVRGLIENWGMSHKAALSQSRRNPADLCVILRSDVDGQVPIGLLYIDSTAPDAFGRNPDHDSEVANDIARALEQHEDVRALGCAVARAMPPLLMAAPKIDITGDVT
jgi:hypothetical protein